MSYLPKNEDNLEGQPQGQTSNDPAAEAPPTQSGGSVGDEGGGQTGAGSATGSPTQFGSSASKLGDYLTANAPQIGQQADKVAGKFNDQYTQLNRGIQDASNQFGQQVQGGYTAGNQDVVNQAASNPTQFAADPNNIKAWQAQYNDQYTGPQNFESTAPYGQIQGQVQSAVNQGNWLQNQAGLASYLQGQSKNPTRASSTLDSLLLSGNPEAQQKIQTAGKQFNNLTGQLESSKGQANSQVKAAQDAAQAANQYAHQQIGQTVDQFGNALNTQLTGANANRDAFNNAVTTNQPLAQQAQQQLLAAQQAAQQKYTGNINNSVGNAAGGAAQNAKLNQLIDPSSYLSQLAPYLSGQPITQPGTLANVSNQGQYSEDAALEALLGQDYNQFLKPNEASQAGSYQVPTLPGSVPNIGGQTQYMGDIASLYGNAGIQNVNAPGGWQNATPQQLAQSAANIRPGQGFNADPATMEALQRLIANQYEGRI